MTHQPNNVSAAGVLLPCPFCGGHAHYEFDADQVAPYGHYHSCDRCAMTTGSSPSKESAIAAWNRRAAASAQANVQAAPIYQTCFMSGQWRDVDRFEYDRAKSLRSDLARIVYAAPSPAAREAGDGVTLTDERIAEIADDNDSGRTTSGRRLFSERNLLAFARALLKEAN